MILVAILALIVAMPAAIKHSIEVTEILRAYYRRIQERKIRSLPLEPPKRTLLFGDGIIPVGINKKNLIAVF
jgi:hypothetical protein